MENERRLIDMDDFIEWLDIGHLRSPIESCYSERDLVVMLEKRPTVDAVDVVRCKDCKNLIFSDFYGECGKGYMGVVRPDDFCSRGERKD